MNMPNQGTSAWLEQRQGKLTASVIGKVITNSGKDSVLRDMVREALGHPRAFTGSAATAYGHEHEDEARIEYAMETGNAVEETGFHLHPQHDWLGASPDGLIGDEGLVEIKCPHSLREADEVPDDLLNLTERDLYWHQMQCQMHVMYRRWCDFVVWCPGEIRIKRYHADPAWLELAIEKCEPFLEQLKAVLADKDEAERIAQEGVKHKGEAPDKLPALNIQMTGGVQASNLPDFKAQALAMIDSIKTELVTDKDFADAESTVKFLQRGEKQLEESKQRALEQTASIAELFDTIDELRETMRQKRLYLNKLVKAEKDNRRIEIQRNAAAEFASFLAKLDCPLEPAHSLGIAGAMKGKKTIATLQAAADDEVARAKIECQQLANEINSNKALLDAEQGDYAFLFSDWRDLIQKKRDDLQAVIAARIAQHKAAEQAKLDAERERIRQEEAAKAQREASEAEAKRQAEEAEKRKPEPQPEPEPLPAAAKQKPLDTSRLSAAADNFQRGSQVKAPEQVTISRKEYEQLLAAQAMLDALKAAGVDNWSGYDDAMEILNAA